MASIQQLILALERFILQPVDNEIIGYLAKGATGAIQRDPTSGVSNRGYRPGSKGCRAPVRVAAERHPV